MASLGTCDITATGDSNCEKCLAAQMAAWAEHGEQPFAEESGNNMDNCLQWDTNGDYYDDWIKCNFGN